MTFERLCSNSNLNILVIDSESKVVRSSTSDVQYLIKQLQEMLGEKDAGKNKHNGSGGKIDWDNPFSDAQFSENQILFGTPDRSSFAI